MSCWEPTADVRKLDLTPLLCFVTDDPVEALAGVAQNVEPVASVIVVQVNVFAPVATGGDVVQGSGELKTKGAGHDGESTFNAGEMLKGLTNSSSAKFRLIPISLAEYCKILRNV